MQVDALGGGSASNNKVAHKRNKAKVQVNNFLDDDFEADIGKRSHTEGHEVLSLAEQKKERDEYLKELELINDLPELLLGQDARNLSSSKFDKKIICDFDDFEMGGAMASVAATD